ncbi:hypothetical protein G846_02436 [Escherichia coli HVH 194 (4-2356805)]|nr:hypothetical protein G846_02436 [Escherichia coli HVH 194 (4-2356805)]
MTESRVGLYGDGIDVKPAWNEIGPPTEAGEIPSAYHKAVPYVNQVYSYIYINQWPGIPACARRIDAGQEIPRIWAVFPGAL